MHLPDKPVEKKPFIAFIHPSFFGESTMTILEGDDFEAIALKQLNAIYQKPMIEPAIFKPDMLPKKNEPWYRQFDKKRKK